MFIALMFFGGIKVRRLNEMSVPRWNHTYLVSPFSSDTVGFERLEKRTCSDVCTRFNKDFVPQAGSQIWAGDTSGCDVGIHSTDDLEDAVRRINLYRWLVGIENATVTTVKDKNAQCQKCALIMDANSDLSHDPPSSWKCWTKEGRDGASVSNIAWLQHTAPYAVRTYIEDPGVISLGHRRWLLYPALNTIGIGQRRKGNCIQIINDDYQWKDNIPFVAYPAPGYFPYSEVFGYWSFAAEYVLTDATVSIVRSDGTPVPCKVDASSAKFGWYGQPTILIQPTNTNLIKSGYSYTVTVTSQSNKKTWVYTTKLVDCSSKCPEPECRCKDVVKSRAEELMKLFDDTIQSMFTA